LTTAVTAIAASALIFVLQKLLMGSSGIKQLTGRSFLMPLNAVISVLSLDAQDLAWTPVFAEYASLPALSGRTEPVIKGKKNCFSLP
jgi:hypothetical protein